MRREEGREMATLQFQDLLVKRFSGKSRWQTTESFGRLVALWMAARRYLSKAKSWKNIAGPW